MKLPLLLSVPHAGLEIPDGLRDLCILSERQVHEDSDEGAAEIYDLADEIEAFVTTPIARAIVDLNRAEDDRRADGVVKTHTCWEVPVYRQPLDEELAGELLDRYYRPYHRRLTELSTSGVFAGVDCHTMAAAGPPIGPDPGAKRPWVCLGNADGTCPTTWIEELACCFEHALGPCVQINEPFAGGHITRSHATEMPWIQLELSREPFLPNRDKRRRVLAALRRWSVWLETSGNGALRRAIEV